MANKKIGLVTLEYICEKGEWTYKGRADRSNEIFFIVSGEAKPIFIDSNSMLFSIYRISFSISLHSCFRFHRKRKLHRRDRRHRVLRRGVQAR